MNNKKLKKASVGPSLKTVETKAEFIEILKRLDYAVFDFDGTIYPRLFLFDLTKQIFSNYNESKKYKKKLKELYNIANIYGEGEFILAYSRFIKLLKGEDKEEFQRNARQLMNNTYPYAKLTIKKLKEKYGINSHLISITADFIAEIAQEQLGLDLIFAVKYLSRMNNVKEEFNGKTIGRIQNQQIMKKRMLFRLQNLLPYANKNNFISFFDSEDDVQIARDAILRVGINPKQNLSKLVILDAILRDKTKDPWKLFYKFI